MNDVALAFLARLHSMQQRLGPLERLVLELMVQDSIDGVALVTVRWQQVRVAVRHCHSVLRVQMLVNVGATLMIVRICSTVLILKPYRTELAYQNRCIRH